MEVRLTCAIRERYYKNDVSGLSFAKFRHPGHWRSAIVAIDLLFLKLATSTALRMMKPRWTLHSPFVTTRIVIHAIARMRPRRQEHFKANLSVVPCRRREPLLASTERARNQIQRFPVSLQARKETANCW